VGTVAVLNGDEVLVEAPLQALHPVEEAGWFKRLLDALRLWFAGLCG
jgi:D-alanyl-D-alanine carboxypeptidase (penicillin-binding protein 5/6)